jgi:hypothetical protein
MPPGTSTPIISRRQDRLVVIDVAQEQVERVYALHESRFQPLPFVRGNDARHEVERNESLGARVLAVHGERDPDAMEQTLGLFALLRDPIGRRALQPVGERTVMRSHGAVARTHFVIGRGRHRGLFRSNVGYKQDLRPRTKSVPKQDTPARR